MRFARESFPFIAVTLAAGAVVGAVFHFVGDVFVARVCAAVSVFLAGFMLFFFRDPTRVVVAKPGELVSGADGVVRSVENVTESEFIKGPAVRVSVFLSAFDVHINRTPVGGTISGFKHTPGKKLFAYLEAASEYNENNSIFITGGEVPCLVRQIVGPLARRVVCWYKPGHVLGKGDRVGLMKFGSRLDVFFPRDSVTVLVEKGDRVVGGRTVIARLA